jgi:hypothetical protein
VLLLDLSVERVEGAVALFHRVALADVQNFDDVDVVRLDARVLDQSVLRDEERAHGMAKMHRRGRKSQSSKKAHTLRLRILFSLFCFFLPAQCAPGDRSPSQTLLVTPAGRRKY